MGFYLARATMAHLVCFAIGLQAIELLRLIKKPVAASIWPGVDANLKRFVVAELVLTIMTFLFPSALLFVLLFALYLWICTRFRGSINGGSDAMTIVALTGLAIAYSTRREVIGQLGLYYVAIHLTLSYLKAGLAKLRQSDWRSGKALPGFLSQSLFKDVRVFGEWLKARPRASLTLCWLAMIFEIGMVATVFLSSSLGLVFATAVVFHFVIYWAFGLNRFFWIWLSAWPSYFFVAQIIATKI